MTEDGSEDTEETAQFEPANHGILVDSDGHRWSARGNINSMTYLITIRLPALNTPVEGPMATAGHHCAGGLALAEALKHNRTLQDLLLRTNQLGDAGETW